MRAYLRAHKAVIRRAVLHFLNYQLLFFVIDIVLHELGHAVAALAVGVTLSEIGIGRDGLAPVVFVTRRLPELSNIVIGYAGGLFSALVFLVVFGIMRYRDRVSGRTACTVLGAALLSRVTLSLLNAVFEGAFPSLYLFARTAAVLPAAMVMNIASVIAVVGTVSLYLMLNPKINVP